jgi:hypothetical protein
MDKLPEPEFKNDRLFPRLLVDADRDMQTMRNKYLKYLLAIGGITIGKYYRDITFYDKNLAKFAGIAILFGFAAHSIASYLAYDPYHLAAVKNNEHEQDFIRRYGEILREYRNKNIKVPENLLY